MVTILTRQAPFLWEWEIFDGELEVVAYGEAWTMRGALKAADAAELAYWLKQG